MRREKGGSLWRGQRDEGHQERNTHTESICAEEGVNGIF